MRVHDRDVEIAVAGRLLGGRLTVPERASGLVVLATDGAGQDGRRLEHVTRVLHDAGLATLHLELRTAEEELAQEWTLREGSNVELVAHRLEVARDWLQRDDILSLLPVGYLGSGLGAAAALVAAAHQPRGVQAVVTLGGRPDMAGEFLHDVRAPTLLLAAAEDADRVALNRRVFDALKYRKALQLIEGATRGFPEDAPLAAAARLASAWFSDCFRAAAGPGVIEWTGDSTAP
ncbi:alpha/beta hydrolase [Pyxidicoccus fallax]|uniref:Alpha/beta hydrolase n=1 Tax=Pyxidicoccus fallax TaxID=394095 RepID=A0A848LPU7_9BACT|nr:dienelactone hydrolase family protein [Pyxidicoccus fallax]NMO19915.1 alpha/beta hydrolase [Pyxidicoccus fallax]NPC82008.1 alpha/beta hydrolase [Pyxidicoccus fallax]